MPWTYAKSRISSAGWLLLTVLACLFGLVSLRYALPVVPQPATLPNFHTRHGWLIVHAVSASVALLVGPWQFLPVLRRRRLTHRWLGRIYCAAVVVGWLASLPIAAHAAAGPVAAGGFLCLGFAWILTTAMGYIRIRSGDVHAHRRWMVRSYALTAAAITLRLYLPAALASGVPFLKAYPVIAWACWVPNLLFAEWLVRFSRTQRLST